MLADQKNTATEAAEPIAFIRMRGLPWATRKDEIQAFFEGVDLPDQNIMILLMPDGRSSGESLIGFYSEDEYSKALAYDKKYIGTRYIELSASSQAEWDRVHNRESRTLQIPMQDGSFIILMRGLPYSSHEDDCIAFFDKVKPLGVHLPKDSMGRPSGQGYAEFATREDFQTAMMNNQKNMSNRYIELFESNIGDLKRAMNPGPGSEVVPQKSRGNNNDYYSPPGGNGNNPYVTSVVQQQAYCLKMRGLPYNTSESQITTFFAEAKVTPNRIHRKSDGGEAFVEFATPGEQDTALKLHKSFLGSRYVELFPISYEEVARKVGLHPRGPPRQQPWRPPTGPYNYNPHQGGYQGYHGGSGGPPHGGQGGPQGNPGGQGGPQGNPHRRSFQPYGGWGGGARPDQSGYHANRW